MPWNLMCGSTETVALYQPNGPGLGTTETDIALNG